MSNYVQQMWETQNVQRQQHGRAVRALGWTIVVAAALSATAYLLEPYWYPYVQQYL